MGVYYFTKPMAYMTLAGLLPAQACSMALALAASIAKLNDKLCGNSRGEGGTITVSMGVHSALSMISHMEMATTGAPELRPVAQGEAPGVALG